MEKKTSQLVKQEIFSKYSVFGVFDEYRFFYNNINKYKILNCLIKKFFKLTLNPSIIFESSLRNCTKQTIFTVIN